MSIIAGKIMQQATVLSVIMLLSTPPSMADGDMPLTFKVRASRPSCTVTSDKSGTIQIPDVPLQRLKENTDINKTGEGATFKLTLSHCTGAGGLLSPKVKVWGSRSLESDYLFSDPRSTAKNVGFVFRANTALGNSGGAWFKCTKGQCTTPDNAKSIDFLVNSPGQLMDGKTMDFWVGVSRDGAGTGQTVGDLTASMHFDVVFE